MDEIAALDALAFVSLDLSFGETVRYEPYGGQVIEAMRVAVDRPGPSRDPETGSMLTTELRAFVPGLAADGIELAKQGDRMEVASTYGETPAWHTIVKVEHGDAGGWWVTLR